MAVFAQNLKKSYIGWTRKNPGIHPSYNFCDFPSKMTIWAQKWKFWNFSEFSLNLIGDTCSHKILVTYPTIHIVNKSKDAQSNVF